MRVAGEISPVSAEQSATYNNNDANYGARFAIDLKFGTYSWVTAGPDGALWLMAILDKVYCVEQVIRYLSLDNPLQTWTCTSQDCGKCVGTKCSSFILTVSTEEAFPDLSSVSDCRHGDIVKIERIDGSDRINVKEIAIVGKSGFQKFNTLQFCISAI